MNKKLEQRIKKLVKDSEANWVEHKRIIEETRDIINEDPTWDDLKEVDKNFGKKVNHYPGDITTHRIGKTFTKLLEKA